HAGKSFQEPLVKREYRLYPGLLKHDLGEPDLVGIARSPPGKVPAVLVEPSQEVFGAPHRVILDMYNSQFGRQAPKKKSSQLSLGAPSFPREGGSRGGGTISPGWLLWLYPCI